MITVTASSLPTNTLTPVVDGAGTTSPAVAGMPAIDGFSTTLNTQLNLQGQPPTAVMTLATPTATLLAAMTTASTNSPLATTEVATNATAAAMTTVTTPTAQQATVSTTINAPVVMPETAMSAEDTAILSNVNDTLKYITAGSKLGDTLPVGQTVQLPTANSATPLTQQSVQSAVQQAVTNTQVNTPAAVLAQQVTPMEVKIVAQQPANVDVPVVPTQIVVQQPSTKVETTPVTTAQIATQQAVTNTSEDIVVTTQTQQTPVTKNEQVATAQAQQTSTSEKNVLTAQAQQTPTSEKNVVTAPAQQTSVTKNELVATTAQTPTSEKNVVTASAQQTPVTKNELVATTQAQQTPASAKVVITAQAQQTPVTEETVVTAQTQQTPVVTEKSVLINQTQTAVDKTAVKIAPPEQKTGQVETQKISVSTAKVSQAVIEQIPPDETVQVQENVMPVMAKVANKISKPTDITEQNVPVLLTETAISTALKNVSIQENSVDNPMQNLAESVESETKKTESQDSPVVQVMPENTPIVTAQAVPAQIETEKNVASEVASDGVTEEKPTMTPAKNLLADVLANRTGGDTASNNSGNNGNNTPSNPALQSDLLLNQTADNKAGTADLKSFASLFSAEKSDVMSASMTAPTGDKSAPQGITAAVNKLVQDTKVDVPALTRPLSHPDWNQEMGERIVWMNNRGVSSAEIKMNPQNLGPITVRIDMNQDQATIAFTAQNSDVRNALEASIPKLREMLNSQQVNLAEVNVSQQSTTNSDSSRSQQQAAQMAADASANGQGNRQNNPELDTDGNSIRQLNANGEEVMVDEFANGQVLDTNGTNGLLSFYA